MLKFMYITNNIYVAKAAELSGVDWIFVDLEQIGKEKRQANLNTVKSKHSIDDVKKVKEVLNSSKLIVRINPIHYNTNDEINKCIENGADILMLPYFKSYSEVISFLEIVNKRVQTCLLLETPDAVNELELILNDTRIDYIHIGLNDLHLELKLKFMFELLSNGMIDKIVDKIKKKKIVYGFGGIAGLGEGDLPSELIINEHYRLGSSLAILSRSFYNQTGNENNVNAVYNILHSKIEKIRNYEGYVKTLTEKELIDSRKKLISKVKMIVRNKVNL